MRPQITIVELKIRRFCFVSLFPTWTHIITIFRYIPAYHFGL